MHCTAFAPGTRFAVITLGCKVNQYESHALREAWLAQGLIETPDPALAGLICINTCAVTAKAVADVRAACRKANRANPQAAIVLTGCAAQVLHDELASLPGVVAVVPQSAKADLLSLRSISFYRGVQGPEARTGRACPDGVSKGAKPLWPGFAVSGYDRSRAMVKVQDGCSHRCAFCIVPLARGPSRSRDMAETLAEIRRLLAAGFRELTLSGINLAHYGRDLNPTRAGQAAPDFWDLVAYLDKELAPQWAGQARLRLSSLEPGQLESKALDTLGISRLIAPHLHLSLQSGSPAVLRRMGRGHYDPAKLPGFCADLARVWPFFGLGADILTGFPAETDGQALETEALSTVLPFSYAHVFSYSPRPGTAAATWAGQVEAAVKKTRSARLRRIIAGKKDAFLQKSLELPLVHVAHEGGEAVEKAAGPEGGINEYYSDCRFVGAVLPGPEARRNLIAAKPVGVEKGVLLVRPGV